MTEKEFLNTIAKGKEDIIQILLDALANRGIDYCVIGGLAVNAYAEPVVSLDLDIVIAAEDVDTICQSLESVFKIEQFAHSINLKSSKSDLRIQIQTDPRYQKFIKKAKKRTLMGYEMRVASIEDVLQGKIWAYSDQQRRQSKRQKDLADIYRLIEAYPELKAMLPEDLISDE